MSNIEKTIQKTDGKGNLFTIPNPDYYNEEGKKIKKIITNFTPKKKKRK